MLPKKANALFFCYNVYLDAFQSQMAADVEALYLPPNRVGRRAGSCFGFRLV